MRASSQSGFTLIEIMVVLVIGVALMAVAAPMVSRGVDQAELRASARQIAAAFRFARSQAISRQQQATVDINTETRVFSVTGRKKKYDIPEHLDILLETTEEEIFEDGDGGSFRFFPDGTSTGGRLTLGFHERKYLIDIDWLTGQAEITEETE